VGVGRLQPYGDTCALTTAAVVGQAPGSTDLISITANGDARRRAASSGISQKLVSLHLLVALRLRDASQPRFAALAIVVLCAGLAFYWGDFIPAGCVVGSDDLSDAIRSAGRPHTGFGVAQPGEGLKVMLCLVGPALLCLGVLSLRGRVK
jgi:hypothetical protein